MLFLFTVGKQDAKCGHLGTTFAVFIHLSSTFAGWWNFVFQKIIIMFIIIIVNDHNYVFCFFDFSEFWQKNDVARQQNLNFN